VRIRGGGERVRLIADLLSYRPHAHDLVGDLTQCLDERLVVLGHGCVVFAVASTEARLQSPRFEYW
jgi:hypothetical protein